MKRPHKGRLTLNVPRYHRTIRSGTHLKLFFSQFQARKRFGTKLGPHNLVLDHWPLITDKADWIYLPELTHARRHLTLVQLPQSLNLHSKFQKTFVMLQQMHYHKIYLQAISVHVRCDRFESFMNGWRRWPNEPEQWWEFQVNTDGSPPRKRTLSHGENER